MIFQNDIRKTVLIINLLPLSSKCTLFACLVKVDLGLFNTFFFFLIPRQPHHAAFTSRVRRRDTVRGKGFLSGWVYSLGSFWLFQHRPLKCEWVLQHQVPAASLALSSWTTCRPAIVGFQKFGGSPPSQGFVAGRLWLRHLPVNTDPLEDRSAVCSRGRISTKSC